jgi:methyl-accepting chemotaxis protein
MNKLSFQTRLLLLLFIPLTLFGISSGYLLIQDSKNIQTADRVLHKTSLTSSSLVLNADRDMYQALAAYQQLQLTFLSPKEKELALTDYKKNVAQVTEGLQAALTIMKEQQLELLAHPDTGKTVADIMSTTESHFKVWAESTGANIATGQFNSSSHLEQYNRAREDVRLFGEIVEYYAAEEMAQIKAANKSLTWLLSILAILVFATLSSIGILLIRQINGTVRKVMTKTKQISEGDLRIMPEKTYAKDELGQILLGIDGMAMNVRGLVESISEHTRFVAAATEELSIGAKESAEASTHVAQNIQEVSLQVEVQADISEEANHTMTEMSAGALRMAANITIIAEQSQDTSQQVENGSLSMSSLKEQLTQIGEALSQMSESIKHLTEKSNQIGSITSNITSFAQQTNILSLNASIEAARAGEHGKGFAVVAQEIRKLAANSLESADGISSLIEETRQEIMNASQRMQLSLAQTTQGNLIMSDVVERFTRISEAVKEVNDQIIDSSAITEQLSASSTEVAASLSRTEETSKHVAAKAQNVAAATEEQAALIENIAKSSVQLQDIVKELEKAVRYFKV